MDQEAMDQIRRLIVSRLTQPGTAASTAHPCEANEVYAQVCGYDIVLTIEPL